MFKSPSSKVEREEDEGNSFLTAILKARFLTVCLGCVVVLLVGGRLLEELLATARSLRSWPSLSPREGGVAGMVEKSSLQSSVCVCMSEGESKVKCVCKKYSLTFKHILTLTQTG